jgi:CopG family transcriptional regulator/antitoxin EndoAI
LCFSEFAVDSGGVDMSETKNTAEIVVRLPKKLITELENVVLQENEDRNEFISQATKMYLRERKKRHNREAMRSGYMEMAKINLNLASEAFHAESEANHTLERLVSGG